MPVTVKPEMEMQPVTVAVGDELDVAQVAGDAFLTVRLVEHSGERINQLFVGTPEEGWPAHDEEFDVGGELPHGPQRAEVARRWLRGSPDGNGTVPPQGRAGEVMLPEISPGQRAGAVSVGSAVSAWQGEVASGEAFATAASGAASAVGRLRA